MGRSTIVQGMRFSHTEYPVVGLPVDSLWDGLQSSKGCVSPTLSMQLSVSRLLAYGTYRTVYNYPMDTFLLHWVCSCQFPGCWPIGRSTIIQRMRFSCSEYAIVGLPVVGLSDGLQSSKGCVPLALDMQLSIRFTIIQRMRFFCTEYTIVGPPVVGLSDGLQSSKGCVSSALSMQLLARFIIIQGMRFFCTEYAIVSLQVTSLSDGLQSPKRCVSPALSMQLSVSWSLAYRTVYNHLRDAFLLHWVCNFWSSRR